MKKVSRSSVKDQSTNPRKEQPISSNVTGLERVLLSLQNFLLPEGNKKLVVAKKMRMMLLQEPFKL